MNHSLPSPLPTFERRLLLMAGRLVPRNEREDWAHTWQAELWHAYHGRVRTRRRTLFASADLAFGLMADAAWLRLDSWERAWSGTPALCLTTLAGLCVLAMLMTLVLTGGWHAMFAYLRGPFVRFLIATPLVVFVAYGNSERSRVESSERRTMRRIFAKLFFGAKMLLLLELAFLLSVDVFQPMHLSFPATADLLQIFAFVLFALIGLRWAFDDQEQRCRQCLRCLTSPAKVGRPSHNLLEWNGTEQVCRDGHGLLSVPEMQTSWCQSSRWSGPSSGEAAVV